MREVRRGGVFQPMRKGGAGDVEEIESVAIRQPPLGGAYVTRGGNGCDIHT